MTNIWTLSESLEPGIPFQEVGNQKSVTIGEGPSARTINFIDAGCGFPRCNATHVLGASPQPIGPRRYLAARNVWQGAFLLVDTRHLKFKDVDSTRFDLTNSWTGIETSAPIYVQWGNPRARTLVQLAALNDQSVSFVADQYQRYQRVYCSRGRLHLQPANADEFARALARRALVKDPSDHRTLLWTYHALKELDMLKHWSSVLQIRMAKLER